MGGCMVWVVVWCGWLYNGWLYGLGGCMVWELTYDGAIFAFSSTSNESRFSFTHTLSRASQKLPTSTPSTPSTFIRWPSSMAFLMHGSHSI